MRAALSTTVASSAFTATAVPATAVAATAVPAVAAALSAPGLPSATAVATSALPSATTVATAVRAGAGGRGGGRGAGGAEQRHFERGQHPRRPVGVRHGHAGASRRLHLPRPCLPCRDCPGPCRDFTDWYSVCQVLRIEVRDECGDEIAISGLDDLVEIAIPLQRASYTEAQWARIENPADMPPSAANADDERGCPPADGGPTGEGEGAPLQHNSSTPSGNATAPLDSATLPGEEGSGPSGAVTCVPGGCLSGADCDGHGDCVRGVCECDRGFLGANCSLVATCLYWDGSAAAWSDRGCVMASSPSRRKSDGFVYCRCNHLTDFGGVVLPSTPAELLDELTSIKFNTFTLDEACLCVHVHQMHTRTRTRACASRACTHMDMHMHALTPMQLLASFGGFDLDANPSVYAFIFTCSFLDAMTLVSTRPEPWPPARLRS